MNNRLPRLNFLTVYNKRGATKNIQCPDKPLHCKAFRASFTLSAAGYIGSRDPVLRSQLPLGTRGFAAQAVALANDIRLPFRQTFIHQLPNPDVTLPGIEVVQHGVLHTYYVHEKKIVSVFVGFQRLGKRYFPLELFLASEKHEDLICYPHTLARQDHRNHRPGMGSQYRPRRSLRRRKDRCGPSPRPTRCP